MEIPKHQFDSLHKTEVGETKNGLDFLPPINQELFTTERESKILPREAIENETRLKEARLRTELASALSDIYERKEDQSDNFIDLANNGQVNPDDLTIIYQQLRALLSSDENNVRLIIYLPFELLPSGAKAAISATLEKAISDFVEEYRRAWIQLLPEREIRANFTDGDIPEGDADPEMVCKAAHLAPELIRRGVISKDQLEKILNQTQDPLLIKNLNEALTVAASWESEDFTASKSPEDGVREKPDFATVKDGFAASLKELESYYGSVKQGENGYTEARIRWEQWDRRERIITSYAQAVSGTIMSGDLEMGLFFQSFHDLNTYNDLKVMLMRALMFAGEEKDSEEWCKEAVPEVERVWQEEDSEVQDGILSLLSHWYQLRLVDRGIFDRLSITIPRLDEDFDVQKKKVEPEEEALEQTLKIIEDDPVLSGCLYPVCLLYGSRLKGYARLNADLDIAVFIKPGVDFAERDQFTDKVNTLFKEKVGVGKVVEFWLEEDGDRLKVRENLHTLPHSPVLASRDWAHVLLQGIWYGDGDTRNLIGRIMREYLLPNERSEDEYQLDRAVWVRELERDVLQYRLMHRGYDKYMPSRRYAKYQKLQGIDGNSAFYDPGFRRLATLLYLKKVFLPDLGSK